METKTAIHIQPGSYTGPRIQKGKTTPSETQPAAPVNPQPESSAKEKEGDQGSQNLVRLSPTQLRMVTELKSRDQEVRTHEQAHVAAGGGHVNGGIRYVYQKGPDGRMYAIGGEVSIDVSSIPGDPEATAQKMERVRRAAMAPSDPSPQDRKVASRATLIRSDALQELTLMQMETRRETMRTATDGEGPYASPKAERGSLFSLRA